jgi:hypothetical protein
LEFDQSYAPAVAKLVDLFSRMTALDGKLSQLYLNRPSCVNPSITNPELMARGLERFDRDHPSLLKQVQLIAKSGAQVWPPIVRRDLSSTIPVIEDIRHSPAWHTPAARSAREAEEKANHERLANYYENQKKESEAREAASVAK